MIELIEIIEKFYWNCYRADISAIIDKISVIFDGIEITHIIFNDTMIELTIQLILVRFTRRQMELVDTLEATGIATLFSIGIPAKCWR